EVRLQQVGDAGRDCDRDAPHLCHIRRPRPVWHPERAHPAARRNPGEPMRYLNTLPAALAAALMLAGCDAPPPADPSGVAGDAGDTAITGDGGLRYGAIAFEPCALSVPGADAV